MGHLHPPCGLLSGRFEQDQRPYSWRMKMFRDADWRNDGWKGIGKTPGSLA
jgi:hypothetical protein